MIRPGSWPWFARHELRLAWRDAAAMLRGRRRGGLLAVAIVIATITIVLHLIAYGVLAPAAVSLLHPDKTTLVAATGSAFLAWTLSLSQAMETATRSFYARGDLDLILSSPTTSARLFAIRIGAIAVSSTLMAVLVIGPFIDILALLCGPRFLFAYGVLFAMGCSASAVAVCLTVVLFAVFGPRRTRALAQVLAALVGAGFVIGVQAMAIVSFGSLSRIAIFRSPQWLARAPDLGSALWWPVRAGMGDERALAIVLAVALALLAISMVVGARAFAQNALAVAGAAQGVGAKAARPIALKLRTQAQVLRRKEWMLLWRDPWLLSQSLMQVLYLVPPALLLWRDVGASISSVVVLVPVLVMAAGQLGGGLAWLALSGEDAPDLVLTAPIGAPALLRAKVEAVMSAVALPILPFAAVMAWGSPSAALTTLAGAGLAAAGATTIQLFFKSQAKRSNFRRRQTSSRFATFAEALLSISVAGGAGLAAAGEWLAVLPLGIAAGVLVVSGALTGALGS